MFEDNISDGNGATIIISQSVFDKRALATTDLNSLAISLNNMQYLSSNFPVRFAILLQSNGCLELLIRKTKVLSTLSGSKAEISFSAALTCIASAAAAGNSTIRRRIIQAKLIPSLIPILHAACMVLDLVHKKPGAANHGKQVCLQDPQNCRMDTLESDPTADQALMNSSTFDSSSTLSFQDGSEFSFFDESFHDEELPEIRPVRVSDLTMITKIIAYVSKYEEIRAYLRQKYALFPLIENLTLPAVIPEIREWASSCMRNAVKTNDSCAEKKCGLVTCPETRRETEIVWCEHCKSVSYCR